jgi:flagellar biosynthesis/type III secretory pathway protein FliH
MREPRLLAPQEQPVIQATFRPVSGPASADFLASFTNLVKAEEEERARLKTQRQRLAARLWKQRKRSRAALRARVAKSVQKHTAAYRKKMNRKLEEELVRGREQLLELSLQITRSILQQEVSESSQSLITKLKRLLAALPEQAITIHSAETERVRLGEALGTSHPHLRIESSPALERGCVAIESQSSSIEVDWRNELREIERRLRDSLNDAAATASAPSYQE